MAQEKPTEKPAPTPLPAAAPEAPNAAGGAPASSVTVRPLLLRNPELPLIYAPLHEVRASPHGLHLLTYVNPAADPQEIIEQEGELRLPLHANAEILFPIESVESLIYALTDQFKGFILGKIRADAAREGIEIGDDLHIDWVERILAVAKQRMEEAQ